MYIDVGAVYVDIGIDIGIDMGRCHTQHTSRGVQENIFLKKHVIGRCLVSLHITNVIFSPDLRSAPNPENETI